jgi:hypothetical protein
MRGPCRQGTWRMHHMSASFPSQFLSQHLGVTWVMSSRWTNPAFFSLKNSEICADFADSCALQLRQISQPAAGWEISSRIGKGEIYALHQSCVAHVGRLVRQSAVVPAGRDVAPPQLCAQREMRGECRRQDGDPGQVSHHYPDMRPRSFPASTRRLDRSE